MKIQIILSGQVIDTQIISTEPMKIKPSIKDLKRMALKASLEDRKIRIAEAMQASFRIFDVLGKEVDQSGAG